MFFAKWEACLSEAELIRVKFDGGLAATGQLHFYEYSRAQYAMARFIATIEHFRRTGRVTERITVASNVDIIVRSPQKGSFIEDLLVPGIQQGMAAAISTPLSSLISYVWQLLAPRSEKTEDAIEQYTKVRLAELKADTKRLQEHTKQMEILERILAGERATSQTALELAEWALKSNNMAIGRLGYSRERMLQVRDEIGAEVQREEEFSEHKVPLEEIEESTINKLTSRLRPMVSEMALPLRRSANSMSMSHGDSKNAYAHLDPDLVNNIQDRETEDVFVEVYGHVKSYDRDSGVGKVSSDELLRTLNFVVPLRDRRRLRDAVLEAMKKDKVLLICRRVVDRSGLPTSLILIDLDLKPDISARITDDNLG